MIQRRRLLLIRPTKCIALNVLVHKTPTRFGPSSRSAVVQIHFFFFFRWHYSPLWALACRTIPLHFSLSITNSLHLLTHLVLFRPPSLNLSSLFLCSTFVTISFLLCGVVSPTPNPQPEDAQIHH